MWAANKSLRLGPWLVGVRPDVDRTAHAIGALFGAYLDDAANVDESNFSVRRPGSRLRPRPGELYIGGQLAARSDSLTDLLQNLAGYASSVATTPDNVTTTQTRVFVRDGQAVLVDAVRPHLVDDGELPSGVVELPIWEPKVDSTSAVVLVPELLADLQWDAAEVPPPKPGPTSYPIVGVVVMRGDEDIAGLREIWRSASGSLESWRDLLGALHERGSTRAAATGAEYGHHIDDLLR